MNKELLIRSILKKYGSNYRHAFAKLPHLNNYVNKKTPLLNNSFYKLSTKLEWILTNRTDFPICQTCGKKFGQQINVRLNRSYSHFCSKECCNKNIDRNNKIKLSCIKKGKETSEKIRKTCLAKYGVENVSQNSEIRSKMTESLLNNFSNSQTKENILIKYQNSCLKKYGVRYASQAEQVKSKISSSLKNNKIAQEKLEKIRLEKYGVRYSVQLSSVRQKQIEEKNDRAYQTILSWKKYVIPLFSREEYVSRSYHKIYKWKCIKCGNIFEQELNKINSAIPDQHTYIPRCLNCYPLLNASSQKEKELFKFCKSYFPNAKHNNKSLINPLEVDILIPEIKLAIEFNGCYFHSIERKPKHYHLNKTLACEKKGYRLIHIWEDQWDSTKEYIKEKLIYVFKEKDTIKMGKWIILNYDWYPCKEIHGYTYKILQPEIINRNGYKVENCGYIEYIKI